MGAEEKTVITELPEGGAAEVASVHAEELDVTIKLLKRSYVATVDGETWVFPEPTLRVNEIFRLEPLDWVKDELAVAKLFYLLENRTDPDKLGRFTADPEGNEVFAWPPEKELKEQKVFRGAGENDFVPFLDLTSTELTEIYVAWQLSLNAQSRTQRTKLLKQALGTSSPDVVEIVWRLAETAGLKPDEALNLTLGEVIALAEGSEKAYKRAKKQAKER